VLLRLTAIRPGEVVLDVGCGTGQLAERIAALGASRVVGIDPSDRMIGAARAHAAAGVAFERGAAEDIPYDAAFDVVVSNSALEWFSDPPRALARLRRALRTGGRLAIQAPATRDYEPTFVAAMAEVAAAPATRETFARFRSPWFFLETADAYAALIAQARFRVTTSRIDTLCTRVDVDGAMRVFGSGAQAGYLDPTSYGEALPDGYTETVGAIVRAAFARRAGADGMLELAFRRLFLLADAA